MVGAAFQQAFPEEQLAKMDQRELLAAMCFSSYVLLLGLCCKGWGTRVGQIARTERPPVSQVMPDPLQRYQEQEEVGKAQPVLQASSRKAGRQLDVGSFLVGVELSLRQLAPELTQGLLGPLTNGECQTD